ncbi:glycoside hydrolase family 2 protein, partial [bacterium]
MRERTLFNDGWRFRKEDGTEERTLNLPHDWGIEGPFDQTFPGETAKLPWWGVGIYRKRFLSPESDAGRRVFLEIDGAMSHAEIHLNGHFVGAHPYGYASFHLDLTPYLEVGDENELEVRLDNPEESSRWYPGGGIYRNVWLTKTSPVHIPHGGVFVTAPTVTEEAATVNVRVEIDEAVSLATAIYDGENPVAFASAEGARGPFNLRLKVESPRLWSAESPHLYRAVTVVKKNDEIVDRVETAFGIRELRFDAETGLSVNGKPAYLKGVCLHHDLGALGAAFNLRAQERQLQILKEMGCNAIRTAHNPPATELLDLCDRMGFYVIDEFSDTWRVAKKPNGYAKLFDEWHERDLRGMIRRDRNHPCVILWSTGNEVPEQTEDLEVSRRLTAIAHDEDPSRLVTTGNDRPDSATDGFAETIDVFGFNYKPHLYGPFREKYPSIPLYGSETSSTISSRGEYFFPVSEKLEDSMADFQLSSYDTAAPFWATTPDREFRGQDENPSVFGEFVWTGFDYLGEPSPYTTDTT